MDNIYREDWMLRRLRDERVNYPIYPLFNSGKRVSEEYAGVVPAGPSCILRLLKP
jgi:hypothetical protein